MGYAKKSFLDDFELPEITHDTIKKELVKLGKTHQVQKVSSVQDMPLQDRLKYIYSEVTKILGRYKGFIRVIRSDQEYMKYIAKAIKVGVVSFDTETNNSLDPLTCKLMGLCLYIPNTKPVYVPINHCESGTEILLKDQVSFDCIIESFKMLKQANTKLIYHNGKFDMRVCHNTTGVWLPIYWDTMIAQQLLDENELAKLKNQYRVHVDPTIDSYNIEKLFTGLPYAWIDPDVFALYQAIDAYDTYKLYKRQLSLFETDDLSRLYKLFTDIEVPIVSVVSNMEDNGICMDTDFLSRLDAKYRVCMKEQLDKLNAILDEHRYDIRKYQDLGKLDSPVNLDSPQQLAIIIYKILGATPIEENGKSTDKQTLKQLDIPFTRALLDYKHYNTLITKFTEPLPEWISKKDGKLHANFNQMGKEENNVRTGRFSSSDPNLQQIPSHEKSMRMMFKASDGYCIVGGDYSQQEPRLLTHMCKDENLINTYQNKKDLYATIASFVFKKDYWECMEHWEDGSPNPQGKEVRSKAKSIVLGILYGMGAKLLASILKVSTKECRDILNEFYKMFPSVKQFTAQNEKDAYEKGYVEDYLGRRRHLPDASLNELEITAKKSVITDASVIPNMQKCDCELSITDDELTYLWNQKWQQFQQDNKRYDAKKEFKELAKKNDITVQDNGAFISKTLTQCTNARIQGGQASLTKKAMVSIFNDEEMQRLGFRILVPVHDELLGECPIENVEQVEKRLSYLMIEQAKPECSVPMKVDTYCVKHWYADEVSNTVKSEYMKMLKTSDDGTAYGAMCQKYTELSRETIRKMCDGNFDEKSQLI